MLQRLFLFHFQSVLLLLIFLFSQQSLLAQGDCPNDAGFENGSFEEIPWYAPEPEPWGINHAFGYEWVDNWYCAHGAADLSILTWNYTPEFSAYDGQYMAQMYTGPGFSSTACHNDAIATNLTFTPNTFYNLTFYHRNGTTASSGTSDLTMEVYLTTGQTNQGGTGVMPCEDLNLPVGSQLLFSSSEFNSNNWSFEDICFQATGRFNQLLFVPTSTQANNVNLDGWYVDKVCLTTFGPCEPMADLTACAAEEDYGYISIDCGAGNFDYEWNYPQGSTAMHTSPGTIVEASEGTYSVTVTNGNCGSHTETFTITSSCCEPQPTPCPTPEKLGCKQAQFGFVKLHWGAVPEATMGYEVQIIMNDSDCCGGSGEGNQLPPAFPNTNSYYVQVSSFNTCFSWKVRSLCADGAESEWSDKLCFRPWECFSPIQFSDELINGNNSQLLQPKVFPNPSSGDFNFQLNTEGPLTIGLEIYSSNGQLVKSFPEEYFPDGNYRKNWSSDQRFADGLYYVHFNTNFGVFQEKIILSNNNLNK